MKRTTPPGAKQPALAINPAKPTIVRCAICRNEFIPWRRGMTICLRDHSALEKSK